MSGLVDRLLNLPGTLVAVIVGLLVFAEDALFVGFVLPGETAAVVGGVVASRGHLPYPVIAAVVVLAAIIGDSVGYEIGRRVGPRILDLRIVQRRRARLDAASDFLRRRGGFAVFLARFVAFFRAVMPALAGISKMPYARFLTFNAAGGLVWGIGFTLLGFLAGNSYQAIEGRVGRDAVVAVVAVLVVALVVWRVREHRRDRSPDTGAGAGTDTGADPGTDA